MRPALFVWFLASILAADPLSAQSGCGYVSSARKPPEEKGYYPAQIRQVDGKDVSRSQSRYRLAVGPHRIAVEERIGDSRRGSAKLRMLANRDAKLALKVLDLEVKADGSYHIGARLLEDRSDPQKPQDYWEPAVWRTLVESCH
ncbi:MAG: hypothetical protein IT479_02795 [Xanthomonadales bacterium]|nr:hypothetical protein [Xanthomonadales bacterium]MCC6592178.1 hypothetical protein [Xanthomonadales bacterium]MCE7930317.1 hypothetical protein [Xanthomonadales bacterium PRO6]